MNTFIVTGYDWHADVPSLAEARQVVADEIVSCEDTTETIDLGITITEVDGDRNWVAYHDVDSIVEPVEPDCLRGHDEHDWVDNNDVLGHGGGVTHSYTCATCGLTLHMDTWHDDGRGGQMDHWIEYERREMGDEDWEVQ